jgi:hypothetical protein
MIRRYMFTFVIVQSERFCEILLHKLPHCAKIDSLHAGWALIIAGIDANIDYIIVALSHRTGQLINPRKDHRMTSY